MGETLFDIARRDSARVDRAWHDALGPDDLWTTPPAGLLARLGTTAAGLDVAVAKTRLAQHGRNDAAAEKRRPLLLQFLARFRNPLILILLVASALSAAAGDVPSFVLIAGIVLLSVGLDFVQEMRAQNAVEALRHSVAVQARVRRDGRGVSIAIDRLVPGDVVELIAGDLVPADCRLLESRDLYVNQALLTGEPYPAEKLAGDTASGTGNPTGASNTVFAGTSVISGTAVVLVCLTGQRTALGKLAVSLAEKPPATAFAVGIRRYGLLIMRFVVFCIRTRRFVLRSRPGRLLVGMTMGAVALACGLPLVPVGRWFGFAPPPLAFFAYVVGATLAYLALVEAVKVPFYRAFARSRQAAFSPALTGSA